MRVSDLPTLPRKGRIAGNFVELRRDRLAVFRELQKLGPVAVVHYGPVPVIVVTDPAVIQDVLVDRAYEFHKSTSYRFLEKMLGKGLVTSEGELHKRQRKLAAPALTPKRIAGYARVMGEYAERTAAQWPDEGVIDVADQMMRLTLEVVAKTLFDTSMSSDATELTESFTEGMAWIVDEALRVLHVPLAVPLARHVRMRRAMARLDAMVGRVIAERRQSGDTGDVLSMLLAARDEQGQGMTDRQVRDEAITMIFAGHETTSNGLSWAFYLLTQHPEVHRRLVAELDGVLGGRTPVLADLPRLPFALQVFKEAMRLYPPVPAIGRAANRPLTVAGVDVKAGQMLLVSMYGLHRRADLYPEPEKFDPDRFSAANEAKLPRNAYLPFGAGPRVCIGNHFALMEGQLLLATLAQRFDFSLSPEANVVPRPLVTLTAAHGIHLSVRRRPIAAPRNQVA